MSRGWQTISFFYAGFIPIWELLLFAIPFVFIIFGLAYNGISKYKENLRQREFFSVKEHSRLYREILTLNKQQPEGLDRWYFRPNPKQITLKSMEEWDTVGKMKMVRRHKVEFFKDIKARDAHNKACDEYKSAINELWKKYHADPVSISASKIRRDRFIEIETKLCKDAVMSVSSVAPLAYEIRVILGDERNVKRITLTQKEIEECLKSFDESPSVEPKQRKTKENIKGIVAEKELFLPRNQIFAIPLPDAINTKTAQEVHRKALSQFADLGLTKRSLFYAQMNPTNQYIMDSALLFVAENHREFKPRNESGRLSFYIDYKVDELYLCFGFRVQDNPPFVFFYRDFVHSQEESIMLADSFSIGFILDTIQRIAANNPKPERVKPIKREPNVKEVEIISTHNSPGNGAGEEIPLADLVFGIENPNYFFSHLSKQSQEFVETIVRYVKRTWPFIRAENTKNYLGFRIISNDSPSLYWFWFIEGRDHTLAFIYKNSPENSSKKSLSVEEETLPMIQGVLDQILKEAAPLPSSSAENTSAEDESAFVYINVPVQADPFWERAYIYVPEIRKKYSETVKDEAELTALCVKNHFVIRGGVAVRNNYRSLEKAIYDSEILQPQAKTYIYSNPYDSDTYNRSIQSLIDELYLFRSGDGQYITKFGLQDFGISVNDCQHLLGMVNGFLAKNKFFTFDQLRDYCQSCKFLSFDSSERALVQFIRASQKRNPKTIITDQDTKKTVNSIYHGEQSIKAFFDFILNGAPTMDIYEIRDRVEKLFAVNYCLDIIGRDAEKAGFFYSDDFEKVYIDKSYFYEEIRK